MLGAIDDGGGDQAMRQIVSASFDRQKAAGRNGRRWSEAIRRAFVRKMDLGARFRFATDRHLKVESAGPTPVAEDCGQSQFNFKV